MPDTTSNINKLEQGISVTGDVVFSQVSALSDSADELIQSHHSKGFVVDCKKIMKLDSAGIALLLDWKRQCKLKNIDCFFSELPKQAKSLLTAYHLESLFH